jgi:hypothetical protein
LCPYKIDDASFGRLGLLQKELLVIHPHLTNKADTTLQLLWKVTFQIYMLPTPAVCTLDSVVLVVINAVTFCNTYGLFSFHIC